MRIQSRAICKKCGWNVEAPNGSLYQVIIPACPKCGNVKQGFGYYFPNWDCIMMVWDKSAVIWWKPWTWGRGEWKRIPYENKTVAAKD